MDKKANRFDVDGFLVYLNKEDLENISERDDISANTVLKSECPVVAEGNWDSTATWLFYRTYSEETEYDMTYDKLVDEVLVNKTELF